MFIRSLDEIRGYIAGENSGAADRTVGRVRDACRMLADAPLAGRERPEVRAGIRSRTVGTYVVFYRPIKNGVECVRVVSGYRDLRSLLSE